MRVARDGLMYGRMCPKREGDAGRAASWAHVPEMRGWRGAGLSAGACALMCAGAPLAVVSDAQRLTRIPDLQRVIVSFGVSILADGANPVLVKWGLPRLPSLADALEVYDAGNYLSTTYDWITCAFRGALGGALGVCPFRPRHDQVSGVGLRRPGNDGRLCPRRANPTLSGK